MGCLAGPLPDIDCANSSPLVSDSGEDTCGSREEDADDAPRVPQCRSDCKCKNHGPIDAVTQPEAPAMPASRLTRPSWERLHTMRKHELNERSPTRGTRAICARSYVGSSLQNRLTKPWQLSTTASLNYPICHSRTSRMSSPCWPLWILGHRLTLLTKTATSPELSSADPMGRTKA